LRVLQWLNTFLPDTGGIQSFCAELIPALIDRGHEVLLLTAHTGAPLPDHSMHGQIEVRRVDSLHALLDGDPGRVLRAKIEIDRIIGSFDPDLIHLHPCGPEVVYFNQLRKKRPIPTVVTVHNNYSSVGADFGPNGYLGRVFEPARRIATVSDDASRWLLSLRPELAAKTSTIHNGLPVTHATPVTLPWDPPRLLYAGRIEAQKRLDVLIRAFATVASTHATVRLQIAGTGTQLGAARDLARSLVLEDRLDFLGVVDVESVPRLLDEATVLVLSSDYEGLPVVLLEAARQGRPAVATAVGGVPEVVIHGKTGLLVEPDSPDAMAEGMITLLDDPRRAQRFGDAARQHFIANFSLDTCATSYERLYEAAVAAPATHGDFVTEIETSAPSGE
jgi:glycosyltransferase involved in cell wall biosynthesis